MPEVQLLSGIYLKRANCSRRLRNRYVGHPAFQFLDAFVSKPYFRSLQHIMDCRFHFQFYRCSLMLTISALQSCASVKRLACISTNTHMYFCGGRKFHNTAVVLFTISSYFHLNLYISSLDILPLFSKSCVYSLIVQKE